MLQNDFLFSDEIFGDDQWSDAAPNDLALWSDWTNDESDLELSWHHLPTEQELIDMEADKNTGKLDDFQIRKERRTALRH